MLQKADKDRLDKVLSVLKAANIRFKVAETVRKTGYDKGMVSAYLAGKKPISDNFYSSFMEHFAPDKPALVIKDGDVGKELSKLIETTINQQAAINILMQAFDKISAKAIKTEADKLYAEYVKRQ